MQKRNSHKIFMFIIAGFAGIILFGIGLGFLYSSLPEHHPEKNKEFCEKAEGFGACGTGRKPRSRSRCHEGKPSLFPAPEPKVHQPPPADEGRLIGG